MRACCRLRGDFAIFYAASLEKNAKTVEEKRGRELPVNALNRKAALKVLLRNLSRLLVSVLERVKQWRHFSF